MLSPNSGWSSSGALSSFSLAGITNKRNYRSNSSTTKSNSNENLLNTEDSKMQPESQSSGYNLSEQTFALNFRVESCMDSDNEDDPEAEPLNRNAADNASDEKRNSFLQPPGHEPWWNWDNIGDLHPAHTQPLFHTVEEETETLQSIAAKFKITPTELKVIILSLSLFFSLSLLLKSRPFFPYSV